MLKSLHLPSFAFGLLVAIILACGIGAAANDPGRGHRYDAAPAMGGLGLWIVDHESNVLYNYRRDKYDGGVKYDLIETLDLSLAGGSEIPAKTVDKRP